jgi:hypothetical protein
MICPPLTDDPKHTLLLTNHLYGELNAMQSLAVADSVRPDRAAGLKRRAGFVQDLLRNVQYAAHAYGIDAGPATDLSDSWAGLWRAYPNPVDAIRHYLETVTEDRLYRFLRDTLSPLDRAAAIRAQRADTPPSRRLRRLADDIRSYEGDAPDTRFRLGSQILFADRCGDFDGTRHTWMAEAVRAGRDGDRPRLALDDLVAAIRGRGYLTPTDCGEITAAELANAIDRIAADDPDDGWLSVTQAAREMRRSDVVDGISEKAAKMRIVRACRAWDRGDTDRGLEYRGTGHDRRIEPVRLKAWLLREREVDLDRCEREHGRRGGN